MTSPFSPGVCGGGGKSSMADLLKAGVPAGTDPENLHGFGHGQEGPHECPHYSLTGVGIFLKMRGGGGLTGWVI